MLFGSRTDQCVVGEAGRRPAEPRDKIRERPK